MSRINLLPWRDEYRQEKKKQFYTTLLAMCLIAGAIGFGWVTWVNKMIDNQVERNEMLQTEIRSLDKKIKEIERLEADKADALARLELMQELQGTRTYIVAYLNEIIFAVPEKGVFFNEMVREGTVFTIKGATDSRLKVSELMRKLDKSQWFKNAGLRSIVEDGKNQYGEGWSEFEITVEIDAPSEESDDATNKSTEES